MHDTFQGECLTPYFLWELYSGLMTDISPFFNDVVVDVKREVRQEAPNPRSFLPQSSRMSCRDGIWRRGSEGRRRTTSSSLQFLRLEGNICFFAVVLMKVKKDHFVKRVEEKKHSTCSQVLQTESQTAKKESPRRWALSLVINQRWNCCRNSLEKPPHTAQFFTAMKAQQCGNVFCSTRKSRSAVLCPFITAIWSEVRARWLSVRYGKPQLVSLSRSSWMNNDIM